MDAEEKIAQDTIRIDRLPLTAILKAILKLPVKPNGLALTQEAFIQTFVNAYHTKLQWYHHWFCPGTVARHRFTRAAEPMLRQYAYPLFITTHNPAVYLQIIKDTFNIDSREKEQRDLKTLKEKKWLLTGWWGWLFQKATYFFLGTWQAIIGNLQRLHGYLPLMASRRMHLLCKQSYRAEQERWCLQNGYDSSDSDRLSSSSDSENNTQHTNTDPQLSLFIKRLTNCMTDLVPSEPYLELSLTPTSSDEPITDNLSSTDSQSMLDSLDVNFTFSAKYLSITIAQYNQFSDDNNEHDSDEDSILSSASDDAYPVLSHSLPL